MKKLAKTLFFVPFLALTSCGAKAVTKEVAAERAAGIAAFLEEADVPNLVTFELEASGNYQGYEADGKTKTWVEKEGTKGKYVIDQEKCLASFVVDSYTYINDPADPDSNEDTKSHIEMYLAVEGTNLKLYSNDEDGKVLTVNDCGDEETAQQYFSLYSILFASDAYGILFGMSELDAFVESFTGAYSAYGVEYDSVTEKYFSSGEGNLEVKLLGTVTSEAIYEGYVTTLTSKLDVKVNNNFVTYYAAETVFDYQQGEEPEVDAEKTVIKATVGKGEAKLPKDAAEYVEAAAE